MDLHGPFGITTVSATPAVPISATAFSLASTASWKDTFGVALVAPFDIIVRQAGIYPDFGNAEEIRVLGYNSGGVTSCTRAVNGTTAISITQGMEVYPTLDRALMDRFTGDFNLKAYGARGDGTTDDTAAIVAWMTALSAAHPAIGYAPPGTYIMTSAGNPLLHPAQNDVWIHGAGIGVTTFKAKAGYSGTSLAWLDSNNNRMYDLTIDGNNSAVGVGLTSAVVIDGVNSGLDCVEIKNCLNHGVAVNPNADGWFVTNSILTGNSIAGDSATYLAYAIICAAAASAQKRGRVHGNVIHAWTNCAAFIAGEVEVSNNYIYGNHIQTVATGGGQIAWTADSGVARIINNHIGAGGGAATNGIELDVVNKGVTISGNLIESQAAEGILVQGTSSNYIIANNIVRNNGGAAGIVLGRNEGLAQGNRCYDSAGAGGTQAYGIKIASGVTNVEVLDNNCRGNVNTIGILDSAASTANSIAGNLPGTWVAFTPALDQGGAVAATVNYAAYEIRGRSCRVQAQLTATAAGTGGNEIDMTGLPVPKQSGNNAVAGHGLYFDTGSASYTGAAIFRTANVLYLVRSGSSAGGVGLDPAITIAIGDVFNVDLTYELA